MITVTVSHQNWCKVSQQNPIVVRGQSGYRRKSLKPELVQRFAAKANSRTMVNQAITITVSHQNWCKVLQQKPIVIRDQSSDHLNSYTPELVQSFAEKPNGRMQSGMFCSALRQLPIKVCNLLSCDGRETLSISYKIEVQLNKKSK